MPLYDYGCGECEHTFTAMKRISERNNPGPCEKCGNKNVNLLLSMPAILYSGTGTIHSKTDDGWKDRLKTIKKNNPLGNIDI
jgi:putative FmdB family regulatory protein